MMRVGDMKTSNYVSKKDLPAPPQGMIVTINTVYTETVTSDGQAKLKYLIKFYELPKPFICNPTNGELIEGILGTDLMEQWTGGKVELYFDPTVSMGGKIVGGMRIRRPGNSAPMAEAPPADYASQSGMNRSAPVQGNTQHPAFDDDIPL